MKKTILLFSLITIVTNVNAQFLPQSTLQERAQMAKDDFGSDQIESLGFSSEEIPSRYSLERYCVVSNQKDASSCTGYAVSGAMNIMYNQINDITRYSEQLVNRFDPHFLYCSLKDPDDLYCVTGNGCDCGSYIVEALQLVMDYGCKKMALDPYLKCGTSLTSSHHRQMSYMTESYSIDGWINFVDWKEEGGTDYYRVNIDDMKEAISYGFPLVTGIYTPDDFGDVQLAYTPPKGPTGPHAIVLVGYDDNYKGGSFRVLNSYGDEWGDNGFFWMTYEDLKSNLASSGVYLLYNDDLDYSSWTEPIRLDNFYRADLKSGRLWEGHMNEDYKCDGKGILVGDDFSAIASYNNGVPNGWWFYFGDKEDDFWGALKFEDGEVVEEESFGFVSEEENLFISNNTRGLDLTNEDPDDDTVDMLENIGDQSATPK
jgi:hypothetical protein